MEAILFTFDTSAYSLGGAKIRVFVSRRTRPLIRPRRKNLQSSVCPSSLEVFAFHAWVSELGYVLFFDG
jgi:hypothetical protein